MATQKHIKKRKNIKKNRKMVKTTKKVEEKTPAKKVEVENNKKSLSLSTYSNVGDEYREYKKKLENVSEILSDIKKLDIDGTRSRNQ